MAKVPLSLSGIYCIHNVVSGRRYVGSSVCIRHRWSAHRSELDRGKHISKRMQQSWVKHGSAAFEFIVLEEVPDHGALIEREQYWIDHFAATDAKRGFNTSPTAGNCLGVTASKETRAILSAQRRGVPKSAAHRKAIGDAQRGKIIPLEQRTKLAEATRRHFAENPEARERMREVGRRNGLSNLGRKMAPEFGAAIAARRKASPEETAEHLTKARNLVTAEGRKRAGEKISLKAKGRPRPSMRSLTFEQAEQIRALKSEGWTYDKLVARFDLNRSTIWQIIHGVTYQRP